MATEQEWTDLLVKLRGAKRDLLAYVRSVADGEASLEPGGEWSIKQQIAHLCHAEEGWLSWALAAREAPGAEVGDIPGGFRGFTRDVDMANGHPLHYWITRLKAEWGRTSRVLATANITLEELDRKAPHSSGLEMTVLQLLRGMYRHDRMHGEQMEGKPTSIRPLGSDALS